MKKRNFLVSGLCMLALAALLAVPAQAQVIAPGIDVWTTPNDGSAYVDFSNNPIPAGFFCPTSQLFAQKIEVKGSPLVTNPAGVLGSTDTVVQRATAVDLSNGPNNTAIRVQAISFVNRSPISVPGCNGTFAAKVLLNGQAPVGSMSIFGTSAGGTFNANFAVPGKVIFKNPAGQLLSPVTETVTLATNGAPWAPTVGTGGISYSNPVSIDTNGDGTADHLTPGTTATFHPGWWSGCNPPCPVKVDHNGPHPTLPGPPPPVLPACARDILSAVSLFEADDAVPATESANGQAGEIGEEIGDIGGELEESSVTVLSSVRVGEQILTRINATHHATPCLAVTSTGTHLVAEP